MIDEYVSNILHHDSMRVYRARRDAQRRLVTTRYTILGFISSGTYGRVYKAQSILSDNSSSPQLLLWKFAPLFHPSIRLVREDQRRRSPIHLPFFASFVDGRH